MLKQLSVEGFIEEWLRAHPTVDISMDIWMDAVKRTTANHASYRTFPRVQNVLTLIENSDKNITLGDLDGYRDLFNISVDWSTNQRENLDWSSLNYMWSDYIGGSSGREIRLYKHTDVILKERLQGIFETDKPELDEADI